MYHQTEKKPTLFPNRVFACFVWISEQPWSFPYTALTYFDNLKEVCLLCVTEWICNCNSGWRYF